MVSLSVTEIVIFLIIVSCILVAFGWYSYRPAITDHHTFFTPQRFFNETHSFNIEFRIAVNLTSHDVFSARTPLKIDTIVAHNHTGVPPIDYVNLIIAGAIERDRENFYQGHQISHRLNLGPLNDTAFVGHAEIEYLNGGDKCIYVATNLSDRDTWPYPCPRENDPSFLGYYPIYSIEDYGTKTQYDTNKATIALGWVAVGLTLASMRMLARDFVSLVWEKIRIHYARLGWSLRSYLDKDRNSSDKNKNAEA